MWERVRRLMQGTELSKTDMKTKLVDIYDKFKAMPRESLESYYHQFSQIMSDLERNEILPKAIIANTKFLNSLQPEWQCYVILVRQTTDLHVVTYDHLFDHMRQN